MTKSLLAGGALSGILDIEDVDGNHHLFDFTEIGGRLMGTCSRMLLGVVVDGNGVRCTPTNPVTMLRTLAAYSVPHVHQCDMLIILCNTRRLALRDLNEPLPEQIQARMCAISLR